MNQVAAVSSIVIGLLGKVTMISGAFYPKF